MNEPQSAARIDTRLDSRSISFENLDGKRGSGGTAAGGRKGAAFRIVAAGETVRLADIAGPGQIRHIWMTFPPDEPERMRSLLLEVFYDALEQPSISVPALDFFGLAHGRPAPYQSALTTAQEGRGFNAYFPMPFAQRIRIDFKNAGPAPVILFFQIDYTLGDDIEGLGFLHTSFRRENATTLRRDFVIADGFSGPGRFLGCVVGVRVLNDGMIWYGEGEVKIYRDGDETHPTICGTGLEDYVGTAWGMGQHCAPFQGVAMIVPARRGIFWQLRIALYFVLRRLQSVRLSIMPRFVSFYRWHLPDPIVFQESLKVTIQQIGSIIVPKGHDYLFEHLNRRYEITGNGWLKGEFVGDGGGHAFSLAERRDDYCATAFVYCARPQAVPRIDAAAAIADLARLAGEKKPRKYTA